MTGKKLEMEKAARVTQAKLPKLKITQFNGTTSDWARFENMFVTVETCTKLKLRPARHELKEIIRVNSSTNSLGQFEIMIESLDGKAHQEDIELTESKLNDFTTIRRPDMNQLNMNPGGSYPFHMILGDKMYCKIRTEKMFKGNPGDRVVEGPTFGGIIHDGNYIRANSACS